MAKKLNKSTDAKLLSRKKRHRRSRGKVAGSAERPRFCVSKSNRYMIAQLIDDDKGVTLLRAQTPKGEVANVKFATELGKEVATKAKTLGLTKVVFDRGGFIYHGKIAAVAQGAREAGLQF